MKPVTLRKLIKAIERHGWRLLLISGSHHIYGREGRIVRLSIPVHGERPLKTGLARQLMKLAGIEESEL